MEAATVVWRRPLVDGGLGSSSGMGPAGRVQLVVGDGPPVLLGSAGGQVLGPHT